MTKFNYCLTNWPITKVSFTLLVFYLQVVKVPIHYSFNKKKASINFTAAMMLIKGMWLSVRTKL